MYYPLYSNIIPKGGFLFRFLKKGFETGVLHMHIFKTGSMYISKF